MPHPGAAFQRHAVLVLFLGVATLAWYGTTHRKVYSSGAQLSMEDGPEASTGKLTSKIGCLEGEVGSKSDETSEFDCSTMQEEHGPYFEDRTAHYAVCRSKTHPHVWTCPRSHTKSPTSPFCAARPSGRRRTSTIAAGCTISGLHLPATALSNGCVNGSPLAEGTRCYVTCQPCWKPTGRQPVCKQRVFDPGALNCEFMPEVCAKPAPSRGHHVCRSDGAGKLKSEVPRIAYCIAGHARSLYLSKNYLSLKHVTPVRVLAAVNNPQS